MAWPPTFRLFILVASIFAAAAKPNYPKLEGECAPTDGSAVGLTTRLAMAKIENKEWPIEVGVAHVWPTDVPGSTFGEPLSLYCNWTSSGTFTPSGGVRDPEGNAIQVYEGGLRWLPPLSIESRFFNVRGLVYKNEVAAILDIMRDPKMIFDLGPDTVDQQTAHEVFVFNGKPGDHEPDHEDPAIVKARLAARKALSKIMDPILEHRITPFVREKYPGVCSGRAGRGCTPCFSLVRKYKEGERRQHGIHRDGQALITVVVSLTEYGSEYTGGLYVSAGESRMVLPLNRGDAVAHQYDLLHGVDVTGTGERWSWILWYKDSEDCEQFGHEWSRECAKAGDALCQYLYGWRVHLDPQQSESEKGEERRRWMLKSAQQSFPEAMFKTARNELSTDVEAAMNWFRLACAAGDADACFQLGQIQLMLASERSKGEDAGTNRLNWAERESAKALAYFEAAAVAGSSCSRGGVYGMYNLGVAHLFGMAGLPRDPEVAAQWFEASGLPEGMMAAAHHRRAMGEAEEAKRWEERAKLAGFGSLERKMTLQQVGYSLHSRWPEVKMGKIPAPPEWS